MTDAMAIGSLASARATQFRRALSELEEPRVLELGTLRWDTNFPTHHRDWAPHGDWVLSDVNPGTDVDVVADAHQLIQMPGRRPEALRRLIGDSAGVFEPRSFDAYVAISVYEHLARPWIAAEQADAVLGPGGLLYVETHQTFPLHGYPDDYFRFSASALRVIFEDAGFEVIDAGYSYPCRIEPPAEVTRWNRAPDVEAWLNVDLFARKPSE